DHAPRQLVLVGREVVVAHRERPCRDRHPVDHAGITGSTTLPPCTAFSATTSCVCRPIGSPVFGLRSSRGKFEDETSIRMRCPAAKTLDVGGRLISTSYSMPGSINSSDSQL